MVIDVAFVTGLIQTFFMPGCVMHRGQSRAVDKVIVALHALALMSGFDVWLLEWVFGRITSATTDIWAGGGELRMLGAPNILRAYLQRSHGVGMDALVALGVNAQDKLFAYSIRISGWGRLFGNLMKRSAESCANWPLILASIRTLCRFFRVKDWRMTIVEAISSTYPETTSLLKSFTGTVAK